MRVTTKAIFDIESGAVLAWEGFDYCGPVEECKGARKSKKLAEKQLALQNRLTQQQLALQQRFASPLIAATAPFLEDGGQGFTPEEFAALQGQAIEGTSRRFEDIERRLKVGLTRRGAAGGLVPISGDFTRSIAGFNFARESQRAAGLRELNISNAMLRRSNFFNAANIRLGGAATFSPAPFVSGAASALSNRTRLAFKPSLGATLGGAAIGAAAGLFTGGLAGGGGGGGGFAPIPRPGTDVSGLFGPLSGGG